MKRISVHKFDKMSICISKIVIPIVLIFFSSLVAQELTSNQSQALSNCSIGKVTSPEENQRYYIGDTLIIKWEDTASEVQKFTFDLIYPLSDDENGAERLDSEKIEANKTDDDKNLWTATWPIDSATVRNSEKYWIRVNHEDDDSCSRKSKSFLIGPVLRLLKPNSLEYWTVNEENTIQWEYEGKLSHIKLTYSSDPSFSIEELVADKIESNSRQYEWIPMEKIDSCYIKISDADSDHTIAALPDSSDYPIIISDSLKIIRPTSSIFEMTTSIYDSIKFLAEGGYGKKEWKIIGDDIRLYGLEWEWDQEKALISGAPDRAGEISVTVKVFDEAEPQRSDSKTIIIHVLQKVAVKTETLPYGFLGKEIDFPDMEAQYGTPPYKNWSWSNHPSGLFLSSDGEINGVPKSVFSGLVSFTVQDNKNIISEPRQLYFAVVDSITIPVDTLEFTTGIKADLILSADKLNGNPKWEIIESKDKFHNAGLTLEPNGNISGTPIYADHFLILVQVTDLTTTQTAQKWIYINIIKRVRVDPNQIIPYGFVDLTYTSYQMLAQFGTGPYLNWTWKPVPPGLTMSSNGIISGIPTQSFNDSISFTVEDKKGIQSEEKNIFFNVYNKVLIPDQNFSFMKNEQIPANDTLTAYNLVGSPIWDITNDKDRDSLKSVGLGINRLGKFTGVPNRLENFDIEVTVTDSITGQISNPKSIPIIITDESVLNISPSPEDIDTTRLSMYQQEFVAYDQSGNEVSADWVKANLSPNSLEGRQEGGKYFLDYTVAEPCTVKFALTATDSFARTGTRNYSINFFDIVEIIKPSSGTTLNLDQCTFFSYEIEAKGIIKNATFTVDENSSLPPGITLDEKTGRLSGTCSSAKNYPNIKIKVTDSYDNNSDSVTIDFFVTHFDSLTITSEIPDSFKVGESYNLTWDSKKPVIVSLIKTIKKIDCQITLGQIDNNNMIEYIFDYPCSDTCKFQIFSKDCHDVICKSNSFKIVSQNNFSKKMQPILASGLDRNSYRLISVPYYLYENHISKNLSELGQVDTTKWRIYDTNNEFVNNKVVTKWEIYRKKNDNEMILKPGKSFLFISSFVLGDLTFVNGYEITDFEYLIPLERGWNLIANPYLNTTIVNSIDGYLLRRKSSVSLLNWQNNNSRILSYTGSWVPIKAATIRSVDNGVEWCHIDNSQFQSWKGYALHSEKNDVLYVRPNWKELNLISSADSSLAKNYAWNLRISASTKMTKDEYNSIAINSEARVGFDQFDEYEPPPIGNYVSLYFLQPEDNATHGRLCTDVQCLIDEGNYWDFNIDANIEEEIEVTISNIESIPKEYHIILFDKRLGLKYDLREKNFFITDKANMGYRLIVTSSNKMEQFLPTPKNFIVMSNYPNPFNTSTTIRYQIPERDAISVNIFNIHGELVRSLIANEEISPGFHEIKWNGTDKNNIPVGAGLYFCAIKYRSSHLVIKMVIVK